MGQFTEILCDIASVIMVGPASPLLFLTYEPWTYCDLLSGHPPSSTRIDNMLKVLEEMDHSSSIFKSDLNNMSKGWRKYLRRAEIAHVGSDEDDYLKHKDYVLKYKTFMKKNFRRIKDFVSNIVVVANENDRFTPSKWEVAKNFVEDDNLATNSSFWNRLDIPTLVNVPWIRIARDFPKYMRKTEGETSASNKAIVTLRLEDVKYTSVIVQRILEIPKEYFL